MFYLNQLGHIEIMGYMWFLDYLQPQPPTARAKELLGPTIKLSKENFIIHWDIIVIIIICKWFICGKIVLILFLDSIGVSVVFSDRSSFLTSISS